MIKQFRILVVFPIQLNLCKRKNITASVPIEITKICIDYFKLKNDRKYTPKILVYLHSLYS